MGRIAPGGFHGEKFEQQQPLPTLRWSRDGGQTARVRPSRAGCPSTHHKAIRDCHPITVFGFFLIAGIMAIMIRLQLFEPENHIVSDQVYNELFTMHGTLMLLLFATPLFIGFANVIMPLAEIRRA